VANGKTLRKRLLARNNTEPPAFDDETMADLGSVIIDRFELATVVAVAYMKTNSNPTIAA